MMVWNDDSDKDDPTDLRCQNCGEKYRLNVPRVIRALKVKIFLKSETWRLCWVCTRLHHAAQDLSDNHLQG